METVYLGLGSNMGQRENNLKHALTFLAENVNIERISPIYETEPVGYGDQKWFLNLVCCGKTALDPSELLTFAKAVELTLGREQSFRNAPRIIDIDILIFGDSIIHLQNLVIPHPRLIERGFVLVPFADIAPDLIHPENGKAINDLLLELNDSKQVREWGNVPSIS